MDRKSCEAVSTKSLAWNDATNECVHPAPVACRLICPLTIDRIVALMKVGRAVSIKIKLRNSSGLERVRFRGVHFDPGYQFSVDLNDGEGASIEDVPNGSIGLTAYRVSDQQSLDTMHYPVTDTQGFAAILMFDEDDEFQPYKLVGEPFVIE